ncbi:MAG: efflux RND transporter periplasmic adaptor subunit [Fibrobacter sp.]|uniref:efflux RND transporter periplasmic adaptor subunit n=1 Tax=uncultured Fibrobacter sp. TaxID=261512 RepID=UPI0026385E8B|nr:efflux RND transporter periplasmic adaptor subunit [uncultured Fibrobacter sp.]MBR6853967.1 efflux RND transporter periplasmic adaptor subunit [Fibrobacter sp.]
MLGKALFTALALAASALAQQGFDGVTEPINQARVGFTVSGKIDSIWVKEGAFVHKGDTLMNLVNREERLRVRITGITANDSSAVLSARAKLQAYKKDLDATRNLFENSNSVSAEQVWEKQMNHDVAAAELTSAEVERERAKLEHDVAGAELEKRVLTAPFDGEIVSISKNKGESVEALEPVIEIADVRTCRMVAYVVANRSGKLKPGQQVSLSLDGRKQVRRKKGTIEFVSPVVDKSSMLRTVKVIFDNTDLAVEPGVTGKILLK